MKRIIAIGLTVTLLLLVVCSTGMFSYAETEKGSSGIIRVLLTKLNLTDRVEIALDGSYSLDAITFQRGCKLVISCTSGDIIVYYEGMALPCGKEVTLTRHAVASAEENGFRVDGGFYLHPGDLRLSVSDGALRAVLIAPIEEYLLGVVPYEMSDSFPLEALKAQAIAARTYALRKQLSSTGDYDVVDNTNDQAYYGVKADYKNAAKAVADTAGICGYYQGQLAQCYYSASNGGQTETVEHVWSTNGGNYGYLSVTDDPYDIENPESVVLSYVIPKQLSGNSSLGVLEESILLALSEQMEALGYDGDAENIRVTGITDVRATTPKYLDSKLMTKLYFSMTVQGRKMTDSASAAEEQDVSMFSTVTDAPAETPGNKVQLGDFENVGEVMHAELNIFPEVEAVCGLDINTSSNNEIYTIVQTDAAFRIEVRRFGHGVGMSQRGAQWMAGEYGWTCEQILRFYYPGLTFQNANLTLVTPTAIASEFLITPGPAATPTPRPTLMPVTAQLQDGQYKAIVNQISENSYLNLRSEPNQNSTVVRQLYYGQMLIVLSESDGWLKVKTDASEGYVMSKFVERTTE